MSIPCPGWPSSSLSGNPIPMPLVFPLATVPLTISSPPASLSLAKIPKHSQLSSSLAIPFMSQDPFHFLETSASSPGWSIITIQLMTLGTSLPLECSTLVPSTYQVHSPCKLLTLTLSTKSLKLCTFPDLSSEHGS